MCSEDGAPQAWGRVTGSRICGDSKRDGVSPHGPTGAEGHVGAVDGTHMNTHTRMHTHEHPWHTGADVPSPGTRTNTHVPIPGAHTHILTPPDSSLLVPSSPTQTPPWQQGTVSPHPRPPLHLRSSPVGTTLSPPSLWDPPEPGTAAVPPPRRHWAVPRDTPRPPRGQVTMTPGGCGRVASPAVPSRPPLPGAGWGCQLEAIY